jgi:hypothetical protein
VDLNDVAAASGLTADALVARHAGRDYRVYMLDFSRLCLPGHARRGDLCRQARDAAREGARRAVGVAGRQTGIYPRESPGGWALLGRSPLPMFDASKRVPSRFAPGDRVRFVPTQSADWKELAGVAVSEFSAVPAIEIRRAGLMTTVQDTGRWGHQLEGVSLAGAMDRLAHRVANALVGNESFAATLEITVVGPELTWPHPTRSLPWLALTCRRTSAIDRFPQHQAIALKSGSTLSFGQRRSGARAYVAFAAALTRLRCSAVAPRISPVVWVASPDGACVSATA